LTLSLILNDFTFFKDIVNIVIISNIVNYEI